MNHHLPIVPVVLILVLLVTSMCFVAAIAPIEIPCFAPRHLQYSRISGCEG